MSYFTAEIGEYARIKEAHLIAARFNRENERHERNKRMALEIKGLKANAISAAANLDRLNKAYSAFNTAAAAHAEDVEGLTPQINDLGDDLKFATQVLGNSVNGGATTEKPKPAPVVADGNATFQAKL